jgi:hypothetical protein
MRWRDKPTCHFFDENPAVLPVVQATMFELVIDVSQGVDVPATLLAGPGDVVE